MNKYDEDEQLAMFAAKVHLEKTEQEIMPFLDDGEPVGSTQLDLAMQDMFRKEKQKKRVYAVICLTGKVAKKACCVFGVFALVFIMTFITVEAFRIKILNYWIREDKQHVDYLVEYSKDSLKEMGFYYLPQYIPLDYALTNVKPDIQRMVYTNAQGDSIIFMVLDGYDLSLDNESDQEAITINGGYNGFVGCQDGRSYLVWEQDGAYLHLYGNIDQDVLITIAESIKQI